jgi:hypothetical protein
MGSSQEARQTANAKVSALLLEEYEVQVVDQAEQWVFTYSPKARVRGGGFKVTVSKRRNEVTDVVRFQ